MDSSRPYRSQLACCAIWLLAVGGACRRDPAPVTDKTHAASAQPSSSVARVEPSNLPDGIFLVERESERRDALGDAPEGRAIVRFAVDEDEPPRYFVLRMAPFVPLGLATAPVVVAKEGEAFLLHLRFDPDAADRLERFTSEHAGGRIAVIVAGEVASSHKIREAIGGGELQVSCCSKANCESLRDHLAAGL